MKIMKYTTSYKYLFIVWFTICSFLFLMPPNYLPEFEFLFKIKNIDKIFHIGIFFIYSYLFYKICNDNILKAGIFVILFTAVYGITIEFIQRIIGRGFDIQDYIADFFGIMAFVIVLTFVEAFKNFKTKT